MWVTVQDWEDTTDISKKTGNPYPLTRFTGIKHGFEDAPDEEWAKNIMPFDIDEGKFIEEIKKHGKGAKLSLKHKPIKGRQRIVAVEVLQSGSGANASTGGNGSDAIPVPTNEGATTQPPVPVVVPVSDLDPYDRYAVDILTTAMAHSENFKFIKKTETLASLVEKYRAIKKLMKLTDGEETTSSSENVEETSEEFKDIEVAL